MENSRNQTNELPYQPSKATIDDTRLSKRALLLLVTLMSWPREWEITPYGVRKYCKLSPNAQADLFTELEETGYLTDMLLDFPMNRIERLLKVNEPSYLPEGGGQPNCKLSFR